jgi:hypothetical protein
VETVVVALVVGAFGGFAGAAIGPSLGHVLNGWERRDVRRERRREHLRSMIERRIGDYRRYHAAVFTMGARVRNFNWSPLQAYQEFLTKEAEAFPVGGHAWEPYRIEDTQLREYSEAFNDGLNQLHRLLGTILTAPMDSWFAECSARADAVGDLAMKLQLRMDDLDW